MPKPRPPTARRSRRRSPRSWRAAYALLGNFLFARDRFDDGVAVLEKGIEQAEDPIDLIYLLASMYRQKGDVREGATS